jgi:hypothetical protein
LLLQEPDEHRGFSALLPRHETQWARL